MYHGVESGTAAWTHANIFVCPKTTITTYQYAIISIPCVPQNLKHLPGSYLTIHVSSSALHLTAREVT